MQKLRTLQSPTNGFINFHPLTDGIPSVSGFVFVLVIAAICAFVAVVVFRLVNYLHYQSNENYLEKHYIFDKGFPGNPQKPPALSNTLLADGTATRKTVEFSQFLQQRFAVKSINELQEEFFGKDAEAFRRRETIYKGAEK